MNRRQFMESGAMVMGAMAVPSSLAAVALAQPLSWSKEIVFDFSLELQNDPELYARRITMRHRSDGVAYYVTSKQGADPEDAKAMWDYFLTDESPVGPVSDAEYVDGCHRTIVRYNGTIVRMDDGFMRALGVELTTA